MPSPIGHALGGAIVGALLAPASPPRELARRHPAAALLASTTVAVAAVAACLPDVDFLWGRHNMETHSVGAAAAAAAAVWVWRRERRLALAVGLAWLTHVAFDWLGSDDTPPLGVMALWPLSSAFYFADAYVFAAISRRYWLPGFAAHNAWAVVRELAILTPVAAAAVALRTWPARRRPAIRTGTGS
ncbi:MAG: metal-dependent hydrolase [Vicinamibacterales bacterium]